MKSHTRHSVTGVTLPHLFGPTEIAEGIGCSEWWVKEQARQRRIPFTKLGGAYRFTAEHFDEIVRAFEQRPQAAAEPPAAAKPASYVRRSTASPSATRLRAKTPRRAGRTARPLASS